MVITVLVVVAVSLINIPFNAYSQTGEEYVVKGLALTIGLDTANGGAIKYFKFNPTDQMITSSLYLGGGYIVDTVFTDIIPPPVFPDEPMPKDWWPGESINKYAKIELVNKTVYRRTISIEYPIGRHKVELGKYITFYYDKPYIDILYVFKNLEEQPVTINLSTQWLRPISIGLTLDSKFGGDPEDDIQVYGLTTGEVTIYTFYSSWSSPGQKPDVHEGSIGFIGLFSSRNDYNKTPYTIILIPLGETVRETYGVWFETPGLGVGPVSTMIRLEMKSFSIEPDSVKKFKFRLYMGPAIKWMLKEAGLNDRSINRLVELGIVRDIYINEYSKPPYTLTISFNTTSIPDTPIDIFKVNDDNSTTLIKTFIPAKNTELIEIDKPAIYLIRLKNSTGLTMDREYFYEAVKGKVYEPIYSSVKVLFPLKLTPISKVNVEVVDEEDKIINSASITVVFKGRTTFQLKTVNGTASMYIPVGEYTVEVSPLNIMNRSLSDIYVNGEFQTFSKSSDRAYLTVRIEHGKDYLIRIKYIPAAAGITTPFNILIVALVIALAFLVLVFIAIFRRRRRV